MPKKENIEYLQENLKFWEYLEESEKQAILNNTAEMHYQQGQNIHSADQECLGVIMIKTGEVDRKSVV